MELRAEVLERYNRWLDHVSSIELKDVLESMKHDPELINDCFYQDLKFGTGGLRGVLGAGTNRMNDIVVGKATQGIANYLNQQVDIGRKSIAISYDSRHHSKDFAQLVASIMAANSIKVWLYPQLMPTPCLSYAVRYYHCDAGVMITASHNPAKYNGYKVYGPDGCQITDEMAKAIYQCIEMVDPFNDVKVLDFDSGLNQGIIEYIKDDVVESFISNVLDQDPTHGEEQLDLDVAVVYSPLHGTGRIPVVRALKKYGFTNIQLVKSQELPDGEFTTCPYPNPEIKEAMDEGIKMAQQSNADLLIATDPDCDRVGIAVKEIEASDGNYRLLSGNEVGVLLLDFICQQRLKHHTMPKNPVFIKTIVTTDMAKRIADHYGVKTKNVLTGFKYIGEQIGLLEDNNRADDFILGFEESYGYLSGSYVRDKDGVVGSFLIALMFAYYHHQGISLIDKLNDLYLKYGHYVCTLETKEYDGERGAEEMKAIMDHYRNGSIKQFDGHTIVKKIDYLKGVDGLPKSDVIKFEFDNGGSVVLRPSGTEPKLKVYRQLFLNE